MKKAFRFVALLLVFALFASGSVFAQKIRIAMVVKGLGNGFSKPAATAARKPPRNSATSS